MAWLTEVRDYGHQSPPVVIATAVHSQRFTGAIRPRSAPQIPIIGHDCRTNEQMHGINATKLAVPASEFAASKATSKETAFATATAIALHARVGPSFNPTNRDHELFKSSLAVVFWLENDDETEIARPQTENP